MKRITLTIVCAVCCMLAAHAQNLVANNGAVIKVLGGTNLIVAGSVTLNSGSSIDNSGRVALTGDWNNNSGGTGHTGAGEVEMNGAAQTIGGSNVTTFGVLDLTGTGVKSLGVSSQVYGTLQLNDRELATGANSITITNPAPGAVTRTIGFVSSLGLGRLIRQMNSTGGYLFPVGSSLGTARYRPVTITPTNALLTVFAVRFANNNPTADGFNVSLKDADICNVNTAWYHLIERTSGTTAANITIDQVSPESFDAVATWGGAEWDKATPVSSTPTSVTLSNSNFSGPYALADNVPTPVVTAGGPTTFCQGGSVILTSTAADTYLWSTGATTQSITVAATGNYSVSVTYNTAPGCTSASSNVVPVTVNPNPTVFNVTGGGTVCTGGVADVSLSGSETGVNYQLKQNGVNFGSPVPGTGSAISFGGQPGTFTYTVTAINTSTSCGSTMSGSVVVTEVADPIITTNLANTSVCKDGATSFSISVSGGTGLYTYTWYAGGDCSSPTVVQTTSNTAATTDTYIPNTSVPGVWYHRVVVTQSGNGCNTLASACANVLVTNDPTVTVSGGGEICKNTAANLTATVFYGPAPNTCTVQWQSSSSASGPFTDISGATGTTYNTGPLATTTYYVARLHSCTGNGCDDVVSSPAVQVLIDVTPPVASCQDFAVNLSACAPNCGAVSITAAQVDNANSPSSDNCGPVTLSIDKTNFSCAHTGQNTVTLTVTDNNGNTATCTSTVTVNDVTPPNAFCQPGFDLALDQFGNASIGVGDINNGSNDNCTVANLTISPSTFHCGHVGPNTVTLTVTDNHNLVSTCTTVVTVKDENIPNVAPHVDCQPGITVVPLSSSAPGQVTVTPGMVLSNSTDNCGIPTPSVDAPNTFDCSQLGIHTVVVRVTDGAGNQDTCHAQVNIVDDSDPVISCATITVYLGDTPGPNSGGGSTTIVAEALEASPAADNCGIASKVLSQYTFNCAEAGTNVPVSLTVTDVNGNVSTCGGTVIVLDNKDPHAICQDLTVQLDASGNASITASQIDNGSYDNCQVFGTSVSPSNFTCANVGTNTVTLSVVDKSNNAGTCTATVTVEDNIAPSVTCPNDVMAHPNDAGVCGANITTLQLAYSDACGIASVTYTKSGASSGSFTGDDASGFYPVGTTLLQFTTTDVNNNVAICSTIVNVRDIEVPSITCPAPATYSTDAGSCTAALTLTPPATSDNCAVASLEFDRSDNGAGVDGSNDASGVYPKGQTTILWTVTDIHHNMNICTQTIQVNDNEAPVVTTAPGSLDVVLECDDNSGLVAALALAPAATDNCDPTPTMNLVSDVTTPALTCPQEYTRVRTWNFTDDDNNTSLNFTQTIQVVDNTMPEFTACPSDVTINCEDDSSPNATGNALAGDNCSTFSVEFDDVSTQGSDETLCSYYTYSITRTFTATDACGNANSSCVQVINVQDITAPTFTAPANTTIYANAACGYDADPSITGDVTDEDDNCAVGLNATYADAVAAGACTGSYVITRTWTLTDYCNNTTVKTQLITVEDIIDPVLTTPADVTIDCHASNLPDNTGEASATDNCTGSPEITYSDVTTPGGCAGNYIITRTWTAEDDCGNDVSSEQVITVQDTTKPVLTCPADVTVNCHESNAPANTGFASATDNCGSVWISSNDVTTPGNCPGNYTIARTWTAADECGNESSCVQTITVQDTTAPVVICPANITISCEDSQDPSNTGFASATDNCDNATIPGYTDAIVAGNCPGNYTINRTWTATDNCGNAASCVQVITVQDITAPSISCPAIITINCQDSQDPSNTGLATATDNCGIPAVTYSDAITPGNCPGNYTIIRTWTATDACNNATSCTQTIIVVDITAPTITCPANVTINCQDPNDPLSTGSATATDNCDLDVSITSADAIVTGNCPGNYTILRTWTATDDCGNSTACLQTIQVQDVTSPTITCPANVTINCNDSQNPLNTGSASATDNCDAAPVVTYADAITAGNCPGNYTITRTWTATDQCNNMSNCVQTITVQDVTAPVLTCPAAVTINCQDSQDPSNTGAATASDNCDNAVVITSVDTVTAGNCPGNYTIERTWTATDNCGNAVSCVQVITVQDITPPTITCPVAVTISCDASSDPNDTGLASATDNCDNDPVIEYADSTAAGNCPGNYTIFREWTATDNCGNASTCVQVISVQDITDPFWTAAPASLTVECDGAGNTNDLNTWLASFAGDDVCGSATVTHNFTGLSDDCGNTGSATVTFTLTDECGNDIAASATFTIVDGTDPFWTAAPASLTVECDGAGNTNDLNTWLASFAGDDVCGSATVTHDFTGLSDDCGNTGSATVTFTLTDECGNDITADATFTIVDGTDPFWTAAPASLTVECDGAGNTNDLNTWLASFAGDDVCGSATVTHDFTGLSDDCGNTGSATVTFTLTDECGNDITADATFTIVDGTDPFWTAAPASLTVECDGAGNTNDLNTWLASFAGDDVCGSATVTHDFTGLSDDCGNTGSATVTFTLTDECGNDITADATFTIVDGTDPFWTAAPASLTVECDGAGNTNDLNTWLASFAGDDVCGSATVTHDFTGLSDDCGNTGSATVTFTLTDECGNDITADATFTIVDGTDPFWTAAPASLTVECDGAGNTNDLNTWLASFAGDDVCGSATVTHDFTGLSDDCGNTGSATVTFTLTDECGNDIAASATFTIVDGTDPFWTAAPASLTVECDGAGNTNDLNTWLASFAGDDVCGSATVTHDFTGLSDDCGNTGSATVTFTLTDECGNDITADATFTIVDGIDPFWTAAPASLTVECDGAGNTNDLNTWLASFAGDDVCGSATVTHDFTGLSDDCGATGSATVTFTLTDECGNDITADATFTIVDETAPTATNPASSSYECFYDVPAPDPAVVTDEADACDSAPVVTFESEVNDGGEGCATDPQVITRTYLVTDACGNTTTVAHTITVQPTPIVASSVKSVYQCGYNVSCNGAHDGSIDLTVSGGCAPYIFTWLSAPNSGVVQGQEDQSGLAAGIYKVTIQDQNNCVTIHTVVLTQPDALTVTNLSSSTINCNGGSSGINLDVEGGAECQSYTYQWSGPNTVITTTTTTTTTATVSGKVIGSGSGSSSGSSSHNHFDSKKDEAGDNCNISYSSNVVGNPDNNGATFYTIGDHCVFELQHEVPAGTTITVRWRQKSGQSGTSSMKVLVSADGVLFAANAGSPVSTTNESYFNQNFTASAPTRYVWLESTASPDFQVDAITYSFTTTTTTTTTSTSNGGPFSSTSEDISGVGAGTYCVTVTDANGCSLDTCITIAEPNAVQTGICNNQTVLFGYYPENVAQITTNASGGTGPYTYLWSTGETTAAIQVAPTTTTTYAVTVTDANGCTSVGSSIVSVVDVRCGSALDRVAMCNTSNKDQCVKASDVPAKLAAGWKLGGCGGTSLEWQCSNGLDDDANGLRDCEDPSCWITNACGGVNPDLGNGDCGAPVIAGCGCDGGIKSYTVQYNGPAGVTIKAYANNGHSGLLATFNSVATGALLTVNATSGALNNYTYFEIVGTGDVAVYTGCGSVTVSGNADQVVSQTGVSISGNAVGSPNSSGAIFTSAGNTLVLRLAHTLPAGVQYKIYWRKSGTGTANMKVSESANNSTYTQNSGTPATTASTSYIVTTLTTGAATRYLKIESMSGTDFYFDAVTYNYSLQQGPGMTVDPFVTVSYTDMFNSTCSGGTSACSICEPSGYLKLMAVRYQGPSGVTVRARNYPAQTIFQTFYNVQNGDELVVNGTLNGSALDYYTFLEVVGQAGPYANIPTDCNSGNDDALIGRTYGSFRVTGLTDNKDNACNMETPCECEGGISYLGLVYNGPAGGTVHAYANSSHQASLGSFGPLNPGDTIVIRSDAADLLKFNNYTYFTIEGYTPDIAVRTSCGTYLENVQFGSSLTVFGWIDKEENLCNMEDQPVCPCYNGVQEITFEYEEFDSNTVSNATVSFYADPLHQDTIAVFEDVDVGDVMTVWAGDLPGGIFPAITYIQVTAAPSYTVSGNATAVAGSSGVSSTSNATGAPNSSGALFSSAGNYLTVDLGGTIPAGATYTIVWKRSGGSTASMRVFESPNGTAFTQNGSTHTTTSTSYVTVTKTALAPTRYVKIESLSSTDFYVDAVGYSYIVYQNSAPRPDVKFKTSCAELDDLVGETIREFFVQGIIDGDGNICDNSCGIGRTLMCHEPHSHGSSWSSHSHSGNSWGSRWHHYNHHWGHHGNSNWGEASVHAHTHCVKNKDVNKKLQTGDWTLGPCPATAKPESLVVEGEGFMLTAAPNPFNESTTIRFRMTSEERVSLIVYNVAGEQIANLFDGVAQKDQVYQAEFRSQMNADGMYFYRLVTESGDVYIRKLIQAR